MRPISWKGINMHTFSQSDIWIYYIVITLGSVLLISILVIIVLVLAKHFIPEIFLVLGLVAGAGLAKLLISPLYSRPID